MKRQDLIKYIIIGGIILFCFGFIIGLLGNNKNKSNINLKGVSNNYNVDNLEVMDLYYRFNPENELLFNIIGNNSNKDNYATYYKKNEFNYKDLSSDIKNIILLNDADYKSGKFDDSRKCYYMSINSFKTVYKKIFGTEDYKINFDNIVTPKVYIDKDNLCIGTRDSVDYTKVVDTYMVNAVFDKDKISIYERVAFIKISDDYLYFYKDYDMNDLVYKIKVTNKLDMSFINNHSIVSNVLLKYQDDFGLYEYTYLKGKDSYYFESIKK